MKRIVLILSLIFFLSGCNLSVQPDNSKVDKGNNTQPLLRPITSRDSISPTVTNLQLEFFKDIPDSMQGCGTAYTYDTINIDNNKKNSYLFFSDFFIAVIKLNGKDIYLQKDTINSKELTKKTSRLVFKGNGYIITLFIKKIKEIEEASREEGTMEISNDKLKRTYHIHGISGC